ncbi:MAG: arginase family protein [Bacteroidota bacterium]
MSTFEIVKAHSYEQAEYVIRGLPTEAGATSERQGRLSAPNEIRKASANLYAPEKGKENPSVWDAGDLNLPSSDVLEDLKIIEDELSKDFAQGKKVMAIGGTCTIKLGIAQALQHIGKKTGVIYFDSHPDMVSADRPYFGSVLADMIRLPHIAPENCVLLGIRNTERREYEAIEQVGMPYYSAMDIELMGIQQIVEAITNHLESVEVIQLCIDLDVVDPAFAPGVGCPVPGGLASVKLLALINALKHLPIMSLDITEYIPKYDVSGMTALLAARMIQEFTSI